MNPTVKDLIDRFGLQAHPEGGFFKETYRSKETISASSLPSRFGGERSFCTGIYFLLPEGAKSHLHRIKSDEMWHFYLGGPLELAQIPPDGRVEEIILGRNISGGEKLQHVVPAGSWFGAQPRTGSEYSFVGCSVAPGFDFLDFEMGKKVDLVRSFSSAKKVIERFT